MTQAHNPSDPEKAGSRSDSKESFALTEHLLNKITQAMPGIVTIFDARTAHYLYINDTAEQILGYKKEEVLFGKMDVWNLLIHPDDFEPIMAQHIESVERANQTGEDHLVNFEYRIRHADGTYHWLRTTGIVFERDEEDLVKTVLNISVDITDTKESERKLAEANRQLRELASKQEKKLEVREKEIDIIYDHLPSFISYIDTDFRYQFVNKAYEEFYGVDTQQILGKTIRELTGEDTFSRSKPYLERALKGEAVNFQNYFTSPSGENIYMETSYIPHINDAGNVAGLIVMGHNVTEQVEAVHRLEESERHFRHLAENISDIVWMYDPDKEELFYVSASYEEVWGRSREDFKTKRHPELEGVHKDDLPLVEKFYEEQRKHPAQAEYRVVRPDGSVRWVRDRAFPYFDKHGKLVSIMGLAEDISERRQTEQAIRESEQLFRTIADVSPVSLWLTDENGKLVFVNKQWLDFTGTKADLEASPEQWVAPLHPDDRKQAAEAFLAAREKQEYFQLELRVRRAADGQYRWCVVNGVPRYNADGKFAGYAGSCVDITDHKVAETQLLEKNKVLETVNRIGKVLAAELEMDGIVQEVTDVTTELSGAQFGAFFYNVENDKGKAYMLYALSGVPREKFSQFSMPRKTRIFEPTFNGTGIVRLDDVTKDPRFGHNAPYHGMPEGHLPVKSYLAVPVISRSGTVIGGLFFGHSEPGVFTEETEQIVAGVAVQAAIAFDNARLFKQMRESEEQYKSIFNASSDAIMIFDYEGNLVEANPAAHRLHGYEDGQLSGMHGTQVIHPDDHYKFRDFIETVKSGKIYSVSGANVRKDGSIVNIEVVGSGFNYKGIPHLLAVVRDVTEKFKAEEALRESELKFRRMADNVPVMIWLTNPAMECVYLNANWYEYTGQTEEGALGMGWVSAIHPDDAKMVREEFVSAHQRRESFSLTFRLKNKEDEYRWCVDSGIPKYDRTGAFEGFVGTVIDVHERKLAEDEVQKQNLLIKTIMDNATTALFMMDRSGYCTFMNPAAEKMTGYTFEEISQKPLHYMIHHHRPDGSFYPMEECPIDRALPENFDIREHEDIFIRKDSTFFPVSVAVAPIFNGDVPMATVIEVKDITEDQKAQAELELAHMQAEEQRALLYNIFMQAPALIAIIKGEDLVFEMVNPPYQSRFPGRQLLNRPLLEAIPELRDQDIMKLIQGVLTTGEPAKESEYPIQFLVDDSGRMETIYFNFVYQPMFDIHGEVDGIVVFAYDVTEQVMARRAIEESEKRIRTYAEAMPQMAFISDADGNILYYNKRWYEYVGATEDTAGWKWKETTVHHPDDLQRTIDTWTESLRTGKPYQIEYRLRRYDGEYRWHLGRAMPERDETGKILRWYGTNTDIHDQKMLTQELEMRVQERTTELMEAINELRRSNQDLEQFAYVASHDLKEPIRMVSSFTNLLAKQYEKELDENALQYIGFIIEGAARMQLLINDLLSYSRIGRTKSPMEDVDCNEILDIVKTNLRNRIEDTDAKLKIGKLPIVRGIPSQITQLFQNLIENAMKFKGDKPPEIEIGCEHQENQTRFFVKDNGIGIDPQYTERIFVIFQRLHTRDHYPGTGMGLAICKKIVELHGGKIWVESTPGKGTTFFFTLLDRPDEE